MGQWKHLNCSKPSGRDSVQDGILRRICSPAEIASKCGQSNQLNGLISLVDVQVEDPASTQTFSGGSVSFVFERCSTANVEIDIN